MSDGRGHRYWPKKPEGIYNVSKATKKGYHHKHNPTYKPPHAHLSPAEWKRLQRKRRGGK